MQTDPNSYQNSDGDAQTQSEIKQPKQPTVGSSGGRRFFFSRSRRSFLGRIGLFTVASSVGGVLGSTVSSKKGGDFAQATNPSGPNGKLNFNYQKFVNKAFQVRVEAAKLENNIPIPPHPTNGDETRYANKIGSDSRGLPHDARGEVKLEAYNSLTKALATQNPDDFEKIIIGNGRKLVNPQRPLAISLEGINAAQIAVPPPPALFTAQRAAEAVELYWQALLRDVPYSKFQNNTDDPKVLAAVADLNKLSAFRVPKQNGLVTPQTLFRGSVNYVDRSDSSVDTLRPYRAEILHS